MVLFEVGTIACMWKIAGSKTNDAKKVTRIPISFAPLPALSKSRVLIFPVA